MKTVNTIRPQAFTLVETVIVVTLLGVLAAIAIPNYFKARPAVETKACIENLREIDGAKEQWSLQNKKNAGSATVNSEVNAYIKGPVPRCPAGGQYTYQPIDTLPTCTVTGHSI